MSERDRVQMNGVASDCDSEKKKQNKNHFNPVAKALRERER